MNSSKHFPLMKHGVNTLIPVKAMNRIVPMLITLAIAGFSSPSARAISSFVEGFNDFTPVDTAIDSDGFTYVMGSLNGSGLYIYKYDHSGGLVNDFDPMQVTGLGSDFVPVSMAIARNEVLDGDQLYVASTDRIVRINPNGSMDSQQYTDGSIRIHDIAYFPARDAVGNVIGAVYFSGRSMTNKQAVVGRLKASDLTVERKVLYGDTSAGEQNTALSLAVDDVGNVFVGGYISDLSAGGNGLTSIGVSGQWTVNVFYSNSNTIGAIDSLGDAETLIADPDATKATATTTQIAYSGGSFPGGGGDNFALLATARIFISQEQEYTFTSITDDGSQLKVDGNNVINDNSLHGVESRTGTYTLSVGFHDLRYVMFEHGGSQYAVLNFAPSTGGTPGLNTSMIHGNKSYVFKFGTQEATSSRADGSDLGAVETMFFSAGDPRGGGGGYNDLVYHEGWVYGTGYWQGAIPTATGSDGATGRDLEIVRLDTNLRLNKRATVKGSSDIEGFSATADEAGNVYLTGAYGPGSADFISAGGGTFTSIASSRPSRFLAKLDSGFQFKWVEYPIGTPPNFAGGGPDTVVCWNLIQQRLYWTGHFLGNGTLTLGDPEMLVHLGGPQGQGFVAVLEEDGSYTERVYLTIISPFGEGGIQVLPFGGTPEIPETQARIRGSQITASVPDFLYRDLAGNFLDEPSENVIETQAESRLVSTGYSLDDGATTGEQNSYSFTLEQDTEIEFRWAIDYALTIDSDLSGTEGLNSNGLSSKAAGNPDPAVKKHWIRKDELVIAAIDGVVLDLDEYAGKVRYIPMGYSAAGSPNTRTFREDLTTFDFFEFRGIESRQQVPEFVMDGPARIIYRWKRQNSVQVNTTGPESGGLPLIKVNADPDQDVGEEPVQRNGRGVGTFWYDEHTNLEVGSVYKSGLQELQGWYSGDGNVFDLVGDVADLDSQFVYPETDGLVYLSRKVTDLVAPVQVIWDYGDRVFEETVAIGNFVAFSTVDPEVMAKVRRAAEPDGIMVEEGPQGSTAGDMAIWDPGGKKLFPLRPGVIFVQWKTTDPNPDARVLMRLTIEYPEQPHFRHIANTPAVDLDPDADDYMYFRDLVYTENEASTEDGKFQAQRAGKSVLLFEENSTGRQGEAENLRVRVVHTDLMINKLLGPEPAIIGRRIESPYDLAGRRTGFVYHALSRHNPYVYNREVVSGPIIPVNLEFRSEPEHELIVVWYERRDKILWPYQPVRYVPRWPSQAEGLGRIVIASGMGSESVASDGTDQMVLGPITVSQVQEDGTVEQVSYPAETTYNPARFQQVQIYNQPDPGLAGYNPNEEHALMAPSQRFAAVSPRPDAAYALRDNDLNLTTQDAQYTSDPYVLVQFQDRADNQYRMKVYQVVREASSNGSLGLLDYDYRFEQAMDAGEPVIPFYPLPVVIGATPCVGTYGRDGEPDQKITYWRDHKHTPWAVSGDGHFFVYYYYPMATDFWWPGQAKLPGAPVAWLPDTPRFADEDYSAFIDYRRNDQSPPAQEVKYTTRWPENLPVLKTGETLTFAGGEYRADHPTQLVLNESGQVETVETPGLPGVLAWAAGQVVYDDLNPTLEDDQLLSRYTIRTVPVLEERVAELPTETFPAELLPANGRTRVQRGKYIFSELSSSLQRRLTYDPIRQKLVFIGLLNDKGIGDSTLTATPPPLYVLEPNILTPQEYKEIRELSPTPSWSSAVDVLYQRTRNPADLQIGGISNDAYLVGLERKIQRGADGQPIYEGLEYEDVLDEDGNVIGQQVVTDEDGNVIASISRDAGTPAPMEALGPGLAVFSNPNFLDPTDRSLPEVSYVTLAENNSDALGSAPVAVHIIKVDRSQRFRGAIKTILSDNVFDENIILRHSGDFGAHANALVFEWWYRPEDGTEARPPDVEPGKWKLFADPSGDQGRNFFQLTLKGNPSAPEVLLADTLFYVRYRHVNDTVDGVDWAVSQPDGRLELPYEWAGAANSSPRDLDNDGYPDYRAQLAQGWVKRVLDRVNLFEARINDFGGESPATYVSMIEELGQRFEGPVALNQDKDVIENVGLIELYETILDRARSLSIDLTTPISTRGITSALQLAATRLSDFYVLLANEAYVDALDPTIGHGSDSVDYGNLAPAVHAFQNQLANLAEEELVLLRGRDESLGRPVYNRLFWNFVKGEGEAAYAQTYNITDQNNDGFVDELDGQMQFPQGHGDAWGHYLTALRNQYDLLRHPYFNWVSRSESYNLQDVVLSVDFLDERKFAQAAAAKAQAGTEILSLTYRSKYVQDPDGQWQGYQDTDSDRAWGVEGWSRRTGLGAYFDWVTANALLPAEHPNSNLEGIQKVDRTTVDELGLIASNLSAVQFKFDEANKGYHPLGISGNAVPFDINPAKLENLAYDGPTHFEQIYERAVEALQNAVVIWDNANETQNMLRKIGNTEDEFQRSVFMQDVSFRNELIDIFGSPYEGTIGSGKAYPAGYVGPDTMLYMYVDVQSITERTVPQQTQAYANDYAEALEDGAWSGGKSAGLFHVDEIPNSFREAFSPSFQGNASDFAAQHDANQGLNYTDPDDPRIDLVNLNLPVKADGYAYKAPAGWGIRTSPGKLQLHIAQMLQKEVDLASSIAEWDALTGSIIRKIRIISAQFDMDKDVQRLMEDKVIYNSVLNGTKLVYKLVAAGLEIASESAADFSEELKGAFPENTPIAGFSFSVGDIFGPARFGVGVSGEALKGVLKSQKIIFDKLVDITEFAQQVADMAVDLKIDDLQREYAMKQSLAELENLIGDEAILRIRIFKEQEALRELSDQYRALLETGFRLMDQRTNFNKRVAAMTQRNRYQDLTFRLSRNDALQKYHDAFDLAAQYTFLAAKAYDYETNLDPNAPASAGAILTDIIRQRHLGLVKDGKPYIGTGGLAENLAWLRTNYNVLKGQMGFTNPQLEKGKFSLRLEHFRTQLGLESDTEWQSILLDPAHYKEDLWELPEFRRYCRPFAPLSQGKQPGLVIPFSTQIRSGENLFGWPLGGADHAYDPSNYSTKIRAVGVWLTGYDNTLLARTPRAYLIPVGADIMMIPDSNDLEVRAWDVLDQQIPVPLPARSADLDDATWRPLADSLTGVMGETRRFSSFRVYGDNQGATNEPDEDQMTFDSRLVGRSVWNTQWMLIIPGATLHADPEEGLRTLILGPRIDPTDPDSPRTEEGITDIRLFFDTYGYSGN